MDGLRLTAEDIACGIVRGGAKIEQFGRRVVISRQCIISVVCAHGQVTGRKKMMENL
jgi:hypothetical protein